MKKQKTIAEIKTHSFMPRLKNPINTSFTYFLYPALLKLLFDVDLALEKKQVSIEITLPEDSSIQIVNQPFNPENIIVDVDWDGIKKRFEKDEKNALFDFVTNKIYSKEILDLRIKILRIGA